MSSFRKVNFLLSFFFLTSLKAQNCTPEVIFQETQDFQANMFKGTRLIEKIESIVNDLKKINQIIPKEKSEKIALKSCLKKKEKLFSNLIDRADSSLTEKPEYHEILGDFFSLKKEIQAALNSYDKALEFESKNLRLLEKSYASFIALHKINPDKISEINTQTQQFRNTLEEAARRAQKVSEHPNAPIGFTIHYLIYQALIARSLLQTQKELLLWEKISTLIPQNAEFIRARLKALMKINDLKLILSEFNKLHRQNLTNPNDWEVILGFLTNNNYHQEFLTFYNKASDEFKQTHPALKVFMIRSMIELGRIPEAKEILKSINFKMKAPFSKLDEQNRSRLNELDADDLKKQNRLSEALDLYKKALVFSPNPLTIKEKISLLIYEYRKSLNFMPLEATQKDLEEVTELLYKSAFETELKSNLFQIYLHSLKFTQNTKILPRACLRFIQLYPPEKNKSSYKDNCLK